jgi:hypothetical protein
MIPNKACRTLLHQFISSGQFITIQMEGLREMLNSSCPSIIPFLDWLTRANDDVNDILRSIKVLVKAFAACSAVCGLFIHHFIHCCTKSLRYLLYRNIQAS